MPFPEAKRVIYERNPLKQVVCQLRFPPILRIDSEIPAAFQDTIRKDFPDFAETSEWRVEVSPGVKGPVPPEALRQLLQSDGRKNYEFSTEDGQWKVNLTHTFLALTANKYERWEKFEDKLVRPLKSLVDIYRPAFFSRIGLRYIDVIRRSELGLGGVDWSELLQPYVLGMLGAPDVSDHVQHFESTYEIRLSDAESMVRVVTRLVEAEDGEKCYMIDSDFSNTGKTDLDDALRRLDYLRTRGTRLIQWCITEKLHQAMEPEEL